MRVQTASAAAVVAVALVLAIAGPAEANPIALTQEGLVDPSTPQEAEEAPGTIESGDPEPNDPYEVPTGSVEPIAGESTPCDSDLIGDPSDAPDLPGPITIVAAITWGAIKALFR